jgi:AhpD family alkylhydroperoxidase
MPVFIQHTLESAPPGSRRSMAAVRDHLGFLPAATALWAESPHLLDGFGRLNALFEGCTIDPLAREVLVMTVAVRNGCDVCIAMHTPRLRTLGADEALITALVTGDRALPDPHLEAMRAFTLRAHETSGDVGDEALRAFLDAGYTARNALEAVLGIGTYTMSTFANRLTRAPVDEALTSSAGQPT